MRVLGWLTVLLWLWVLASMFVAIASQAQALAA